VFGNRHKTLPADNARLADFAYLKTGDIYLDSACQSLRPQPVLDALNEYYTSYNACGERVKYGWGKKVDSNLALARQEVLKLLELSSTQYSVSFTLNTTYGLNLVLSQLPSTFTKVITSDIEHNSVFLPTIELAKRLRVERLVLPRQADGSLAYQPADLKNAVVVLNAVSNIDGRRLENIKQVIDDTHKNGSIVIIDAAQAVAHYYDWLAGCQADAICFSAHKMYAPTLGVIVIKKGLLSQLSKTFVGGGMVASVTKDTYELLPDAIYTGLEPGLQAYGEISALIAALKWLKTVRPFGQEPDEYLQMLSKRLFDGLKNIDGIKLFNQQASPVISFYPKKGDAHRLAIFLSSAGIMARSGTFCCHYYLNEVLKSPPLLRLSLGLHNTTDDVDMTLQALTKLTKV
jgi:selenocysteine lyase/cysteine desulfurase